MDSTETKNKDTGRFDLSIGQCVLLYIMAISAAFFAIIRLYGLLAHTDNLVDVRFFASKALGVCLIIGMVYWVVIGVSLLNFIIFFLTSRGKLAMTPKQTIRHMEYKHAAKQAETNRIAKHKCAVCGRTDTDYPDLEFRYCSKCAGNYEYCSDHIFTHVHKES